MNLGELIVSLCLDSADFNRSLEKAKSSAVKAAQGIEASFDKYTLTPTVDHDELYKLNKHLNLKEEHYKEVSKYFANNPLTPTINTQELDDLDESLKSLTGRTQVINIQENVRTSRRSSSENPGTRTKRDPSQNLENDLLTAVERGVTRTVSSQMRARQIDGNKSDKESSQAIVGAIKSVNATLNGAIKEAGLEKTFEIIFKPASDLLTGFIEGISSSFGSQVGKGLQSSLSKNFNIYMDNLGEKAGDDFLRAFGVKIRRKKRDIGFMGLGGFARDVVADTAKSGIGLVANKFMSKFIDSNKTTEAVMGFAKGVAINTAKAGSRIAIKKGFSAIRNRRKSSQSTQEPDSEPLNQPTQKRKTHAQKSQQPASQFTPEVISDPWDDPKDQSTKLNTPQTKKREKMPVSVASNQSSPPKVKQQKTNADTPKPSAFDKALKTNEKFGYVIESPKKPIKVRPLSPQQIAQKAAKQAAAIEKSQKEAYSTFKNLMESASDLGDYTKIDKIYADFQSNTLKGKEKIDSLITDAKAAGLDPDGVRKLQGMKAPMTQRSNALKNTYFSEQRKSEKEQSRIGKQVLEGFHQDLKPQNFSKIGYLGATAYMTALKKVFGIESPSKAMIEVGKNILEGLSIGLKKINIIGNPIASIKDAIANQISKINFDPGQLKASAVSALADRGIDINNLPGQIADNSKKIFRYSKVQAKTSLRRLKRSSVVQAGRDAIEQGVEAIPGIADGIKEKFGSIGDIFKKAKNAIPEEWFAPARNIGLLLAAYKGVEFTATNVFGMFEKKTAFSGLGTAANTFRSVLALTGGFPGKIKGLMGLIQIFSGSIVSKIWGGLKIAGLVVAVRKAFSQVSQGGQSLFSKIVPNEAKDTGKNLIQGLKEGVSNNEVVKMATTTASTYIKAIKKTFDINSPSGVMKLIGLYIIQGLVEGLTGNIPGVKKAIGNIKNIVWNDLLLAPRKLNAAMRLSKDPAKMAQNFVTSIPDKIKTAIWVRTGYAPFSPLNAPNPNTPNPNAPNPNTPKILSTAGNVAGHAGKFVLDVFSSLKAGVTKATGRHDIRLGDYLKLFTTGFVKKFLEKQGITNSSMQAAGDILSAARKQNSTFAPVGLFKFAGLAVNELLNPYANLFENFFINNMKGFGMDAFKFAAQGEGIGNVAKMALPLLSPILGRVAKTSGNFLSKALTDNQVIKPGFVNNMINSITGLNLAAPAGKFPKVISGLIGGLDKINDISGKLSFFGKLKGMGLAEPIIDALFYGENAKNLAMYAMGKKGKERKLTPNDVVAIETSNNLESLGLKEGSGISGLVEQVATSAMNALTFKNPKILGSMRGVMEKNKDMITGIKDTIVNGILNIGIIKNNKPGIGGRGFMGRILDAVDAYGSGDVKTAVNKSSVAIKGLTQIVGLKIDPKQIKIVMNALLLGISTFHKAFTEQGLKIGESLWKGIREAQRNWGNAKDDMRRELMKAMGAESSVMILGDIAKRWTKGVVPKHIFREFFDALGKNFQTTKMAMMNPGDRQGLQGNVLSFFASIATAMSPLMTFGSTLMPLVAPLLPVFGALAGAVRMLGVNAERMVAAFKEVEPIQRKLNFIGGSPEGGVAELNYGIEVSDKLNAPVKAGLDAYAQLQVAARGTKLEGAGVKELYEGIAASVSALGISTADASLIYMAYTQMLAKGKISQEELRQQLGEKFPPTMAIFAKSIGKSTTEMIRLAGAGSLLSEDVLMKVGKTLNSEYGSAATGVQGFTVALTKLENTMFRMNVKITNSFGGMFSSIVSIASSGLDVLVKLFDSLQPIFMSLVIGVTAVLGVGLTTILKMPFLKNNIENFTALFSAGIFSAFTNLVPFFVGILSDVADGWLGAQRGLIDNMVQGIGNVFVAIFGYIDTTKRLMSFTGEGAIGNFIGKENADLIGSVHKALAGIGNTIKNIVQFLPHGFVEIGAIVLMMEQSMLLAKQFLGDVVLGLLKGFREIGGSVGRMINQVFTLTTVFDLLGNTFGPTAEVAKQREIFLSQQTSPLGTKQGKTTPGFFQTAWNNFTNNPRVQSTVGTMNQVRAFIRDPKARQQAFKSAGQTAGQFVTLLRSPDAFQPGSAGQSVRNTIFSNNQTGLNFVEKNLKTFNFISNGVNKIEAGFNKIGAGINNLVVPFQNTLQGQKFRTNLVNSPKQFATFLTTPDAWKYDLTGEAYRNALFGNNKNALNFTNNLAKFRNNLVQSPGQFATFFTTPDAWKYNQIGSSSRSQIFDQNKGALNFADNLAKMGDNIGQTFDKVKTKVKQTMLPLTALFSPNDALRKTAIQDWSNLGTAIAGKAQAGMSKLKTFLASIKGLLIEIGIAFAIFMLSRSDFSNPIQTAINDMATGINNSFASMDEQFAKLGKTLDNTNSKITNIKNNLPSKGLELNVGFALGLGGKSYKSDDVINDMNQKYQDESVGLRDIFRMPTSGENIFNIAKSGYIDYEKVYARYAKWANTESVKSAAIEAKRFGLSNQITGKETQLTIAQSQLLGTFKSLEGNTIEMGNELAGRGLTKASVGNLMKGDTLKATKEILALDVKMYELGQKRASLGKQNTASARNEIEGIDKTLLKLQAERDKKAKPFQTTAEDVKDFEKYVENLWSSIQNSDMPIAQQRLAKVWIERLRKQSKEASEIVNENLPVKPLEDIYQKTVNALKDFEIAFERFNTNLEISANRSEQSLYESNPTQGNLGLANRQRQLSTDMAKYQAAKENLAVSEKSLANLLSIPNIERTKERADEIAELRKNVKTQELNVAQLGAGIARSKYELRQELISQSKQAIDYYRTAAREAESVGLEYKKATQRVKENSIQIKLKQALIGATDTIYTQFIESIIDIILQASSEIKNTSIDAERIQMEYRNTIEDIRLQTSDLARSLPGEVIPFNKEVVVDFKDTLKSVDGVVNDINKSTENVAKQWSAGIVDGAKKARAEFRGIDDNIKNIINNLGKLSGVDPNTFNTPNSPNTPNTSKTPKTPKTPNTPSFDYSIPITPWYSPINSQPQIPTYAKGGIVKAIHDGLERERMASGKEPVLAALTPGERVLTVRQNKQFEKLNLAKVLNYAQGGVVGDYKGDSEILLAQAQQPSKNTSQKPATLRPANKPQKNAWDKIKDWGGNAINQLWQGTKDWGGNAINQLWQGAKEIGISFLNIGKNILQSGKKLGTSFSGFWQSTKVLGTGVFDFGKTVFGGIEQLKKTVRTTAKRVVKNIATGKKVVPPVVTKTKKKVVPPVVTKTKKKVVPPVVTKTKKKVVPYLVNASYRPYFVNASYRPLVKPITATQPILSSKQTQQTVTKGGQIKVQTAKRKKDADLLNNQKEKARKQEETLLQMSRKIRETQRTIKEGEQELIKRTLEADIEMNNLLNPQLSAREKDAIARRKFIAEYDAATVKLEEDIKRLTTTNKPDLDAIFNQVLKESGNELLAKQARDTAARAYQLEQKQLKEYKAQLALRKKNRSLVISTRDRDAAKQIEMDLLEQSKESVEKKIQNRQLDLEGIKLSDQYDPTNEKNLAIPKMEYEIQELQRGLKYGDDLNKLQQRLYRREISASMYKDIKSSIDSMNEKQKELNASTFKYADILKGIELQSRNIDKIDFKNSPFTKSVQLQNEAFAIQNPLGLIDIEGLRNELMVKNNEINSAYAKLALETMNPTKGLSESEQLQKQKEDDENKRKELDNANNKYLFDSAMASQVTNPRTLLENQYNRKDMLNSLVMDIKSGQIEGLKGLEFNQFRTNAMSRQLEKIKEVERAERAKNEMILKIREFNLKDPGNALSADEIEKVTQAMDNLSQVNIEEINNKYVTFGQTLSKIFREEMTKGLSSGIMDLINDSKDLEESLQGLANNILNGVLKTALDALISQISDLLRSINLFGNKSNFATDFGGGFGLGDVFGIGSNLDFTSGLGAADFGFIDMGTIFNGFNQGGIVDASIGDKLPNYAKGGVIEAISNGLRRERMASGRQPVLAALTPGERVLTVKQNKRFEELEMNKVLNYSEGGVVGNVPRVGISAPGSNSSVNINIPVSVEGGQGSGVNGALLSEALKGAVLTEIQRQKRPGGALSR